MREVISIHIGQAGIQLGNACWQLFCLEHGIQPDGQFEPQKATKQKSTENDEKHFEAFFRCGDNEKYVPRSVYIDHDNTAIDEVRAGIYRELFQPESLISGKECGASSFARGRLLGERNIEQYMESINKVAEDCSGLQGFIVYAAAGGGTGSGLTQQILQRLSTDFRSKMKLGFTIMPYPLISSAIVEPYNTVLATSQGMLEHLNINCVIENEACYDICRRSLSVIRPTYQNINRLIAQVVSSWTCALRY